VFHKSKFIYALVDPGAEVGECFVDIVGSVKFQQGVQMHVDANT